MQGRVPIDYAHEDCDGLWAPVYALHLTVLYAVVAHREVQDFDGIKQG